MSFKRSIASLAFSVAFLGLALAAPAASAQSCKTTADCGKGFYCLSVPSTPPSEPPVATQPACAAGTVCPVSDPTTPAPTPTKVAPAPKPDPTGICQEAPCKADTDCGTDMICHTQTSTACTGVAYACPANADCAPPPKAADPVCTETKTSTCMYKWQLPCNVDNDCGAGFTCKPTVTGACSGGGGTGVATPGTTTTGSGGTTSTGGAPTPTSAGTAPTPTNTTAVAPVPPDTTCTTTSSFPGYCEPKVTTCTTSTDCPTAWTCESIPTPTPVAAGTTGSAPTGTTGGATGNGVAVGEPSPSGAAGATGTTPGAPPPPTTTTTMCVSPLGVYDTRDVAGTQGTPTGTSNGSGGSTVPTGMPSPTVPGAGNPGSTGNTGSTGGGMTETTGSTMPTAGCAVGGAPSGSPLALMLLGALGLLIARRRRS